MYNFSFGKCRLQDSFDVKRIQMNFSISLASQSKSIDMFDKPQCAQILTIKIVILGGNLRKVKDLVVT